MKDFTELNDKHDHEHDELCEDCGDFELQEIELIDDEGNAAKFLIDEWFDYNGKMYAVAVSAENEDDALLFRVEEEGETMNFYTPDEEEFDEVSKYYEELE